VGDDRKRGVVSLLRQAQEGVPELARRMQLRPYHIKSPQPKQDRNQLWRLAHLLAQLTSPGVGVLHLGCGLPFRHLQGCAEGDVQGHGVLGPLRRLWKGLEQLDPGAQVADGFHIG
jgi:hypothetical protein